jgi:hypothetical protein
LQVVRTGIAVAVVVGDRRLTWGALERDIAPAGKNDSHPGVAEDRVAEDGPSGGRVPDRHSLRAVEGDDVSFAGVRAADQAA